MALYVDIEKKLGSFHLRAKFEVDGETPSSARPAAARA